MTTRDKTGDKLVASIRKTKAGASRPASTPAKPQPSTAQPETAAPPAKPQPRAPAKPKRKPKPATATRNRPAATGAAPGDADQSAGRIWPD